MKMGTGTGLLNIFGFANFISFNRRTKNEELPLVSLGREMESMDPRFFFWGTFITSESLKMFELRHGVNEVYVCICGRQLTWLLCTSFQTFLYTYMYMYLYVK